MGLKPRKRRLGGRADELLPDYVCAVHEEAEDSGQTVSEVFDTGLARTENHPFLQRVLGYIEGVADGSSQPLDSVLAQYAPED